MSMLQPDTVFSSAVFGIKKDSVIPNRAPMATMQRGKRARVIVSWSQEYTYRTTYLGNKKNYKYCKSSSTIILKIISTAVGVGTNL